jgi:hypothetical protein
VIEGEGVGTLTWSVVNVEMISMESLEFAAVLPVGTTLGSGPLDVPDSEYGTIDAF